MANQRLARKRHSPDTESSDSSSLEANKQVETYEKWQRQFEANHNTLMCSTVMLTIKTVSPTGYMFPGGELAEGLMDCRPVPYSH